MPDKKSPMETAYDDAMGTPKKKKGAPLDTKFGMPAAKKPSPAKKVSPAKGMPY
jgi:hypothetical protein